MGAEDATKAGIGKAVINPEAEPIPPNAPTNITAQDEAGFYSRSKREYELEQNRQNLGTLGAFFGANPSTPTHIAGFVALISLALLAATFLSSANEIREIRTSLIALASSAVAYIFGANSKS